MYRINRCIPSSLDNANRGITEILQIMNHIVGEDLLYDIRFILNELVVNSVEHGNEHDIQKKINIQVGINGNEIRIRVKDQGLGFYHDNKDTDCLSLRPDGRGLFIVKHLADRVDINHNEITCIIKCTDSRGN
ncbi:MAG: ATP-binding protein [Tissierellia bacterium]|nr:ATP-binding protein [Tissierellia bacterium]